MRKIRSETFYIECNLSPDERKRPNGRPIGKLIISNCPANRKEMRGSDDEPPISHDPGVPSAPEAREAPVESKAMQGYEACIMKC